MQTERNYYDKPSTHHTQFKAYVDERRAALAEALRLESKYYPLDLIAEQLGTKKDMLQKRLNQQKPATRDFIIALCAVLLCSEDETNEALKRYDMPTLDSWNSREAAIIDFLSENAKPTTVEKLNTFLSERNFRRLDMMKRHPTAKPKLYMPYKVIDHTLRIYYDEGDQYNSLETEYTLRNECALRYTLDAGKGHEITLWAFSDGKLYEGNFPFGKRYETPSESEEFSDYFIEMLQAVASEQRKINEYLDDTRNFKSRFSANLVNDRIHIFYEEFSYRSPILQEYYLMELINGHFQLTVSNKSLFMKMYLGDSEYATNFRSSSTITTMYESLDVLKDERNSTSSSYDKMKLDERIHAFKRLQEKILECLCKLQERKIFVRNLAYIYDSPDDVCRYYDVESNYGCTVNSEILCCIPEKDSAVFSDDDSTTVNISLSELHRAFELGYKDIAQVVRVKRHTGSIESVLS